MSSVPRRGVLAGLLATPLVARGASAQQLTVWHDPGENGNKWFAAMAAEFARTHPDVTLRAEDKLTK